MSPERPIQKEINQHSLFLSEITGLPIIREQLFPELNEIGPNFSPSTEVPFSYNLTLGNDNEQYNIVFRVTFNDEWTPNEWLPNVSWKLSFNDKEVFSQGGMVNISEELYEHEFQNRTKIEPMINSALKRAIGGPVTEVAFMDYETYSLEDLKGKNRYFENIYLALMIHMKERGCVMPPILSNREYVRNPMEAGDTAKIEQVLSSIMAFEGNEFPESVRAHMRYEADDIRKHAAWEAKKRNLNIPLKEAFPYYDVITINEGKELLPHYTILAVENDLRNPRFFSDAVIRSLEKDGRFKGSQIVREVNLPDCMDICAAGRIDIVLFDWTNPSYEEVLMVRHENPNPFYQKYHGDAQGVLQYDEDGIKISTPDGNLMDIEAMKAKAEKLDIRNEWMNMIRQSCEDAGTIVPPSFIIRSQAEFQDISKIISQKLGQSIA